MEMKLAGKTTAGTYDLVIRHQTEELVYSITEEVIKTSQKYGFDHFEQINAYWAQCAPELQSQIFQIYCQIYSVLSTSADIQSMTRALRPLTVALLNLHPFDDLYYWIWVKSDLLVPSGIKWAFNPDEDTSWTREKTYLEDDYRRLVAMTLAMRVMLPVWEEFILQTKKETGSTFKEYQAFDLISGSEIMSSEAMKRLEVFVINTIPKDRNKDAAVFSGVSSEDFPEWILAVTVVKRLTSADIRGINSDHTLVTYLHNYIDQRSRSLENRTGKIKPKYSGDSSSSDENSNHSKLEGFKIKETIAEGDIATIRRYLGRAVEQVTGQIPMTGLSLTNRLSRDENMVKYVQMSLESVKPLFNEILTHQQVTIAAWVLADYIPCQSMPYLNKSDILKIIAFAQAYLWSKGHYSLAGLVSAIPRNFLDAGGSMIADNKTRMDTANVAEIGRLFPYLKRTSSRAKNVKSTNPTLTAIETMVEEISYYQWTLTLPPQWVAELQGTEIALRYRIPENIRDLLAALIIELDVRDGLVISDQMTVTAPKGMETLGI